jgi:putative tricarboxylic transport membrane protein
MLLVLNLPLIGIWVRILRIPQPWLYGGILVFATVGAYGLSHSVVDLVLLYAIGGVGYLMRRFDYPSAPAIIGLILGPLAEQELRRALTISQGDPSVFVTQPLAAALFVVALAALIAPALLRRR